MAEYQIIFNVIAVLIVVVFLVGYTFALIGNVADTLVVEAKNKEEIERTIKSQLVASCLSNGNDVIDADFLDDHKGETLREICGFAFDVKAGLETIPTKHKWTFGNAKNPSHDILVRVNTGNRIELGRLNVTV